MFISQIDIAGLRVEALDSTLRAQVAITADSGRVLVDCQLPTEPMEPANRRTALLHEAIRQLRRMPEYRNGKREIQIADGLLA